MANQCCQIMFLLFCLGSLEHGWKVADAINCYKCTPVPYIGVRCEFLDEFTDLERCPGYHKYCYVLERRRTIEYGPGDIQEKQEYERGCGPGPAVLVYGGTNMTVENQMCATSKDGGTSFCECTYDGCNDKFPSTLLNQTAADAAKPKN